MPIPIILAVAAGVAGLGGGIRGGVKMKQAKDTLELAERMQKKAVENFEKNQEKSTKTMDKLGKTELEIVSSFSKFADCFWAVLAELHLVQQAGLLQQVLQLQL